MNAVQLYRDERRGLRQGMRRKRTAFIEGRYMSLGADYALRLIRLYTDVFDGDVALALVFMAAAQAGTQHLRRTSNVYEQFENGAFPDELRRPVSVSSLARSLAIPVETTRRYVIKLTTLGFARRTAAGGVVVTTDMLRREEVSRVVRANAVNMQQLIHGVSSAPENR
jgi:hypothetical protein